MKLTDHIFNRFSQFGEDGITARILDVLGTSSRICVEFGAEDGLYCSNTANLWQNGWEAVLIEADAAKYASLARNTRGYDCYCINEFVRPEGKQTIEEILKRHERPREIDFLSIDIDGDDYYILDSIKTLRPKVICCEYNPTIPVDLELVPRKGNFFGCSARSLILLAETKGYKLVAMTDTNCFFVEEENHSKFSEYDTSLESLFSERYLTYLMTGYDGDYILSTKPTFGYRRPSETVFYSEYFRPIDEPKSVTSKIGMYMNRLGTLSNKAGSDYRRFSSSSKIRIFASNILAGIGRRFSATSRKFYQPVRIRESEAWDSIRGDDTLRLDYDLDSESIVFDLGGYEGEWASRIFSRYCCCVHVFEPVKEFADNIRKRFAKNPRIIVHRFGLSDSDKKEQISKSASASSLYHGKKVEEIRLLKASKFMLENGIDRITLMKVNIEGGEYELLEHLIEEGLIENVVNLQVQFHDFVPNAQKRMEKIQQNLRETHNLTYSYEFIWENWTLKVVSAV